MRKRKPDITRDLPEAVEVLLKHGYTQRMIISNVDNEIIISDNEEVNKAISYIREQCDGWDAAFAFLIRYLFRHSMK
ncbi:hypothetical protein ACP8H5_21220 [Bacillus subtilis]|uniref:hypothetical protein n=1 Tax=Bacillus subtilis TaxID=1423 RepID=UPI003CEBE1DE